MTLSSHKLTKMLTAFALASQLAGGALFANSVEAADMLGDETVDYTSVEFGTSWYLRGDIGAGLAEAGVAASFSSSELNLGTPMTVSVGAGREFGEGFRLEFALNQFNNLSVGERFLYSDCGLEDHDLDPLTASIPVTGDCHLALNAQVNASSMMANAYVDLGQFFGFKPYIGAGLGAAYVSWTEFTWADHCSGYQATDCGVGGGVGIHTRAQGGYEAQSDFALAANAMLGVSYDISKNVSLDLGYRYTLIDGTGVANTSQNTGILQNWEVEAIDVHEIRLGFRYEIW